jgi:cell division transport system permease protein
MYWSYGIPRALQHVRSNWRTAFYSTLIVAAAFALLGMGVLLYVNVMHLSRLWLSNTSLSLFLKPGLAAEQRGALLGRLRGDRSVSRAVEVSPEEGLRLLAERLGADRALMDGVDARSLPYTIDFDLELEERANIREIAARYRAAPGVEEVVYGERAVERVRGFLNVIRGVGLFLVGLIVLAFWFIVSNAAKLSLYARREEIEILAAVGATRRVIASSFVIEGMLMAAAGFLAALVITFACYEILVGALAWSESTRALAGRTRFLPWEGLVPALLAAVTVAGLGSRIAVSRLLKGMEP